MTQGSKRIDLDFADRTREVIDASARAQSSLSPLAALALGAAHELSGPLSTIAIAAGELEHNYAYRDRGLASLSDVRLIRSQIQRCRAVLIQLVADATALGGEPLQDIALDELLAQLRRELDGRGRMRLAIDSLVSIEDSGSGMTPEVMARATEALFTTKPPGENMGLGLFLTRSVLERIGGALSVAST